MRASRMIGLWVAGAVLAGVSPSFATMEMQKKAKAAGFEIQNCQACHTDKLPKKGATTYNDQGKWLIAEKTKRNAKEVDVNWLKDYAAKK